MRRGVRITLLAALCACGVGLVVLLYHARPRPPLESTLTTTFQLLGVPIKLADRIASRVLPVSALDERTLGDVYRQSYDAAVKASDADQRYLDNLMPTLRSFAAKPFPYRASVIDYREPNAMAFPGGVVLVTRELLRTLHSEAELASVLGHEFGHIERGHCFDAVRFELLARKLGAEPLGQLADLAGQVMLRHAYSKTLEHEADEYAFMLLANSRYDPRGVAAAFRALRDYEAARGQATPRQASPLRDYFSSHPPLEVRADEYAGEASAWWRRHGGEPRYVGRQNLAQRTALAQLELPTEWTLR